MTDTPEPAAAPLPSVGRNAILNAAGYLAPVVIAIAAVPLLLHRIGQERFGVLAITWVVLGFAGGLDLGLGRAATNELARIRDSRPAERSTVLWTALIAALGVSAVAMAGLGVSGWLLFGRWISLSHGVRTEALHAIPVVVAAVPLFMLATVLVGSLEAGERFGSVNGIEVASGLAYQLGPLAIAYLFTRDLRWVTVGAATGPATRFVAGAILARRTVPLLAPTFSRARLVDLLRYGGWISVSSLISPILALVDRPILGAVSGARAVTVYSVPFNLVSRMQVVSYSVCRALFPRLSFVRAAAAESLGRDGVLAIMALTTPLVVAGSLLVGPFLELWVGTSLGERSTPIALVLLVGMWLNGLALVPYTYLQGQGRPFLTALFHALELPLYLAALYLGIHDHGAVGAAFAWSGRVALDFVLLFWVSRIPGWQAAFATSAVWVAGAVAGAELLGSHSATRIALAVVLTTACSLWSYRVSPPRLQRAVRSVIAPLARRPSLRT